MAAKQVGTHLRNTGSIMKISVRKLASCVVFSHTPAALLKRRANSHGYK
jgi:hypothetical protein